jgi:polar amino acid transport system substrate-binding protein
LQFFESSSILNIKAGRYPILDSLDETANSYYKGEEMKKLTIVLSVLMLASLVLAACGAKTTTSTGGTGTAGMPDLKGKTITVAVENAYPPFNSIDEASGKAVGWDYDVVTEICKRLNCVPEFKQAAWDGIFPAMAAGEYDMLADGVTNYPYRYWAVDFSVPYSLVSQQLLVRADDNHTLDQFVADANLKVGTQIGTTNYIAATEFFPDKQIQSYSDFGAATLALLAGDIDGVVLDDTAAFGFMQANQGKLKTAGAVKTGDALAFVFPPYSDLENPVNAALRAMHADGSLAQFNQKWGLSVPPEEPAQ